MTSKVAGNPQQLENNVDGKRSFRLSPATLTIFPLAFLILILGLPIAELARAAFRDEQSFWSFLSRIFTKPLYRSVLINTIWISALVTVATVFVAYPLAYLISHQSRKIGQILLTIVLASMWLSLLIRSYAWTVLLQSNGPISAILAFFGVLDERKSFMFTRTAVIIGMTHIMVPYMVVAITAVGRDASRLRIVASQLGASVSVYFLRIYLPVTARGALAGATLVFILCLGFYITPELLGGGRGETMMVAVLIDEQMNTLGNWSAGAALSLVLLCLVALVVLASLVVTRRFVKRVAVQNE